jgi:hypothetical protein
MDLRRNFRFPPPDKFIEIHRRMARAHNRRMGRLGLVLLGILVLGGYILQEFGQRFPTTKNERLIAIFLLLALLWAVFIPGVIRILRADKAQCVSLGYICPFCGAPLYDNDINRVRTRGECPSCKRFIIDELNKPNQGV